MKQTTAKQPNKKQKTLNDDKPVNMEQPKRKRGRPKGTTGTKRKDRDVFTEPGENTKYISHDMKLYRLPDIDINNPEEVQNRINQYFDICSEDDVKPSIASLALCFHMSRFVLFDCLNERNNRIKNNESIHTLKAAYDLINSYYEHMMNNGKINPVAGIFMMKNNLGYKDTTDYIITPNTNNQLTLSDITNKAGLLED